MTKKENKRGNQVVRDMKECFRSFHLPVYKNKHVKDIDLAFTSQICNDHVCADAAVTFDKERGYARIDISSLAPIPPDRLIEVIRLLDLCNGGLPLYRYFVNRHSNVVYLEASLFIPDGVLPKGKFKRLIRDILEHSYLSFPLITEVMVGANPDAVHARFVDGCKALKEVRNDIPSEAVKTIFRDIESVFDDLGLSIREQDRFDEGFCIHFGRPNQDDHVLCMILEMFKDRELIVFDLFPLFTIPDEKIGSMTESVNWLNMRTATGCMYIDRENRQVKFRKGIMIDKGTLDIKEFRNAIDSMTRTGDFFFFLIKEQLSSNEGLDIVIERFHSKIQR
jgi:hypothetical protein